MTYIHPVNDDRRVAEINALSRVSLGYWRYGREFLDSCKEALSLSVEDLQEGLALLADKDADPDLPDAAAFAFARPDDDDGVFVLTHFYVDPPLIGQGVGRKLWGALGTHLAFHHGGSLVRVVSDPNAVGFFEKMGAKKTGRVESPLSPDGWRITLEGAPDFMDMLESDGGILVL